MALQISVLDVAQAVSGSIASQAALVATVAHLVNSGIVPLCARLGRARAAFDHRGPYRLTALGVATRLIGSVRRSWTARRPVGRRAVGVASIRLGCTPLGGLRRPPAMSARELRAHAWHAVGIDVETASRLAEEHARLHPCADDQPRPQTASDVLDLDERARLMRRIAGFYGRCYAAAPAQLLWAGFAAVAVNDGVRPATELAMTVAELTRLAGSVAPHLGARLREFACAAEDGIKCAFETNYAIFANLGWVHMVYLEHGIEALRELCRNGEIGRELLVGFEDIARGVHIGGARGYRAILRGNLTLFRHEQRATATPVFARYERAIATATAVGLITVPNRALVARGTLLGRRPDWTDVNSTAESYGPYSRRWRWLVKHAWEPAVALHRDRGERGCRLLDAAVARAIEGLPEHRHAVPWRHAMRLAKVAGPLRGASHVRRRPRAIPGAKRRRESNKAGARHP